MHANATPPPNGELDRLADIAQRVLARAKQQGATQAELGINVSTGLNVNVRMHEVETVEHTRDRGLSLTVFVDGRKGSASTADLAESSISATIEQAIAIAKFTEIDPAAGLADADRMATTFHPLDGWHPWLIDGAPLTADAAIEIALRCEAAGMAADARICNTEGASVSTNQSYSLYANSHGFLGREYGTGHSISASLLAGNEDAMERDYYYDSKLCAHDLLGAEAIGVEAARRTLARLNSQPLSTRNAPVLFVPELARGLIGHLLGAIGGGAQYRKASFLLGAAGTKVLPDWFAMAEFPHLLRATGSANFDEEGVATEQSTLVEGGFLTRYLLGSYSARKLGLRSTGNAGGVHNLVVKANAGDFTDMLQRMGTGLLVTELMGQGVNGVTGDYSRGAAGFWVENGALAYPVSEITIAGNLKQIYPSIVAVGSDVDLRGNVRTGAILIEEMMIAG
jgi:PmbA protein